MARSPATPDVSGAPPQAANGYTVVARRYRPRRFEDVVGQDHVVQALRNAIRLNRVTHAYLFSGTRGVGKTSMARIFAKCLNCVQGPTDQPCDECDICQAISVGQDVDVIEIDGASNNGVEAVRELRQNAGLRPSRCRFKIYYIDEVHMLSTGAFNALLKTLEEPPEHVKFFFATTEPNKIPVTILSRCQKYDFAGIRPDQIVETLTDICEREEVEADQQALQIVARRAGGSMRDAQSLLEQLLSFGNQKLSAELVHQALGLAPDDRVLDLLESLADGDLARALTLLDEAAGSGVQPVDLLSALLEFLRDAMILASGAGTELLTAAPGQWERLQTIAKRWPLDSILAALQILAEARGRLRGSPHARLLVEVALGRVARLEDFTELGELIGRLSAMDGVASGPLVKKKSLAADRPNPPAHPDPPSAPPSQSPVSVPARQEEPPPPPPPAKAEPPQAAGPLSIENLEAAWARVQEAVGPPLSRHLGWLRPGELPEPGLLVIPVPPAYNWMAEACDQPEARGRIESAIRDVLGSRLRIRFERVAPPAGSEPPAQSAGSATLLAGELESDPMIQEIIKLFEARPVRVELDDEGKAS